MNTFQKQMLFSVIIPLYNKADTIERTLNSVSAQCCRDFEVIVVDDGSTDTGPHIVRQFKNSFPLTVLRQNNLGVSVARNAGVAVARAKYVAFLDADDEWLPGYLEEIKVMLEMYPGAVVYGTNYYCATRHRLICNRYYQIKRRLVDFMWAWTRRSPIHTSSSVVNKSAFLAVGGFVPTHAYYEDAELLLKLAEQGAFCVSSKPLVKYNSDASIRATDGGRPFSMYAHWLYIEQKLASSEICEGLMRVAICEIDRRLVENFLHGHLETSLNIRDEFPLMFKCTGCKGRIHLTRGNPVSWIVALCMKIKYSILARSAVRSCAI